MPAALNNRRKVERIVIGDGLYAVIHTTPQTLGQVQEISSTGLAFAFVDIGDVSLRFERHATLRLDLFEGGRGFFARDLTCRLVSEIENDTTFPTAPFSIKRVGMAFEKLTLPQQVKINRLVSQRQGE